MKGSRRTKQIAIHTIDANVCSIDIVSLCVNKDFQCTRYQLSIPHVFQTDNINVWLTILIYLKESIGQ